MAKPVQPQGLTPDTLARKAAAKLVRAKVEEVLLYLEPAFAGDVEGLHSLRVAVKRLRETLRLFQRLLPPAERKRVLPLVEEVNDSLGQVRDRDVLRGHAQELAEGAPGAAPALEAALAAWDEQREPGLAAAREVWERVARRERLVPRLRRLARGTAREKGRLAELPLARFAYVAVNARLERVEQRLVEAQATADPAALHRLRIVVKRLKYTLEPFLTAMPALAGPYQTVANIQEALGLAHDFDVLEAALTEFFHGHGRRIKGTAETLRALQARRETLYAAAREVIGALGEAEWARALLDALD
jgi:CHAD domain-containing protein